MTLVNWYGILQIPIGILISYRIGFPEAGALILVLHHFTLRLLSWYYHLALSFGLPGSVLIGLTFQQP